HAVTFKMWSQRRQQWEDIHCPEEWAAALLAQHQWVVSEVRGIVNSPTLRRDLSLLTAEGFDEKTKLVYKPSGAVQLPDIPEQPTKAEAEAALKLRWLSV